MFAFAIWDEKEKELFAAETGFGEKPFFYSFSEGRLVFASEMKALWEAGIERKPNLKCFLILLPLVIQIIHRIHPKLSSMIFINYPRLPVLL